MVFNDYLKCDVCGSIINVKIQGGWLDEFPVAIYCGKCGILIEEKIIQKPMEGRIETKVTNASQISSTLSDYVIQVSGEFPALKEIETTNENYKSYLFSPFIRSFQRGSGEKIKENIIKYLYMEKEEWPRFRRVFELWEIGNSEYLVSELEKIFLVKRNEDIEDFIKKYIHRVFFKQNEIFLTDIKVRSIQKKIHHELKNFQKSDIELILEMYNKNMYFKKCQLKIIKATNKFKEIFEFILPAYDLWFKNKKIDHSFGISTISFEQLKTFYIDLYEILIDMIPLLATLNNLYHRKNIYSNNINSKIKIDELQFKPNNIKLKNLNTKEKFCELLKVTFNNNLRNAIGHYDYHFDGKSQLIKYRNGGNEQGTYLIDLAIDCLNLYNSLLLIEDIIYCIQTNDFDINCIEVDGNDPCPCQSGKKYKQCCGYKQRIN